MPRLYIAFHDNGVVRDIATEPLEGYLPAPSKATSTLALRYALQVKPRYFMLKNLRFPNRWTFRATMNVVSWVRTTIIYWCFASNVFNM